MKKILSLLVLAGMVSACGPSAYVAGTISHEDESINIGYGTITKDMSNSSVGKIKGSRKKSYSSVYDMIQGTVPGVTVSGTTIRIRGENTLYGSSDPLILVDNVPMTDISGIDPMMVESIEVLKDAASASIYGIQGANGVILITLRKE